MRVPAGMHAKGRSCSAAIEATSAWVPSPPAAASPSAPAATASRTSCSRSSPGFSSIGSIPRARASSARLLLTAFPPPDFGFQMTIARFGGSAAGSATRAVKTRPASPTLARRRATATRPTPSRSPVMHDDDRRDDEEREARQQDVAQRSRAVHCVPRRQGTDDEQHDHHRPTREVARRSRRQRRRRRRERAPAPARLLSAGPPLVSFRSVAPHIRRLAPANTTASWRSRQTGNGWFVSPRAIRPPGNQVSCALSTTWSA